MPKRKRGTEKTGAHLTQEPSTCPTLRKSTRLLERDSHQSSPVQKGKKQRRENEHYRALSSSSTTGWTREDSRPTQLSDNNTERLTNDTSFKSHFGKTHSAPFELGADNKRKHGKELGQPSIESGKQPSKSEPAAASPNLDPKERLKLPGDGLFKKQKVQFEKAVPETRIPIVESLEKSAKEVAAREIEQKKRDNPISYWAVHHSWPKNFAEHNPMASSNSPNKRPRTSEYSQSGKDERSRSYSQSRKNREVPKLYTEAYEVHFHTKGLDMGLLRGEECVSEKSKKLCVDLQEFTHKAIEPIIFPKTAIRKVIEFCKTRNEAIVNRDITPMIVPPITSLYFYGDSNLEHVVDEVQADWYDQCVLEGPHLRPDLAIGLFSSAFTEEEIDKLKRYTSVDNWTQVTTHMFFPFLMCEAQCGEDSLDIADRQNMHSCSVAVRALLRIEKEADEYRPEKKMDSLNGQVLVFSISHNQEDARLYGHYAIVQGEKWTYYRYSIRKFDLTDSNSLLAIHNFARNILKSYLPEHIQRLKDALAALPDPNKPAESSDLPGSSGLSFAASGISLNDDNSQQDFQDRDADGFAVLPRPDSSQKGGAKKKGQERQRQEVIKLMQQLDEEREENRKREERQRQDVIKLMQLLNEEIEENRKREERQRQESEQQRQEVIKLMQQLNEEREENRKREERQRQESEQQISKLMDTISALGAKS